VYGDQASPSPLNEISVYLPPHALLPGTRRGFLSSSSVISSLLGVQILTFHFICPLDFLFEFGADFLQRSYFILEERSLCLYIHTEFWAKVADR